MRRSYTSRAGFTVVELIVVIVVTSLLVGVLFGPLRNVYDANEQSIREISQVGDIRSALRFIEGEITPAITFEYMNTVNDPSGSNGNLGSPTQWNWTGISGDGTSNRVFILTTYATTELPSVDEDGSRELVYENDCTTPAINNLVYFVKNGSLYRRTIQSAAATPLCGGLTIAQRTSCAETVSSGVCAGAAKDARIIGNVTNFSVDYYASPRDQYPQDNGGGTGTQTLYTNNSVPNSSQTVVVRITISNGGVSTSSSLRVSRLNGSTL